MEVDLKGKVFIEFVIVVIMINKKDLGVNVYFNEFVFIVCCVNVMMIIIVCFEFLDNGMVDSWKVIVVYGKKFFDIIFDIWNIDMEYFFFVFFKVVGGVVFIGYGYVKWCGYDMYNVNFVCVL